MISPLERAALAGLFEQAGVTAPNFQATVVRRGGNNRVMLVRVGGDTYVAKVYFTDSSDPRDRLAAEWGFLCFAEKAGLRQVPRPLVCNPAEHMALYEFISGEPVPPGSITDADVEAAQAFLAALNTAPARAHATALPAASEACFGLAAHCAMLEGRLQRLRQAVEEKNADPDAIALIGVLSALWDELKSAINAGAHRLGLNPDAELSPAERCISPSDFGFHNAIRRPDGSLSFVDFEYAGWDDPAKTIADFLAHPANSIPERHHAGFAQVALAHVPLEHRRLHLERADLMRPLFGLKWCCILLNAYVPEWAARQVFADDRVSLQRVRRERLQRANMAMATLREECAARQARLLP